MLKALGISIIPASAPDFFIEDTPTAVLCGRCSVPSLSLRRQAPSRNWQRLASASVSVKDDAKEGSRSS